ncbi:MAG: hypothetical protein GX367_00610 [Bacteroidales bacterium]|nr:hypothetical protein [Bacteroidales bacterium]
MSKITTTHKFSRNVEDAFIKALEKFNGDIMLIEVEMNDTRDSTTYEASLDLLINKNRYTFIVETSDGDLYNKFSSFDMGNTPSDDILIKLVNIVLSDSKVLREIESLV